MSTNFKMLARFTLREICIYTLLQYHAKSAKKPSLSFTILFKAAI